MLRPRHLLIALCGLSLWCCTPVAPSAASNTSDADAKAVDPEAIDTTNVQIPEIPESTFETTKAEGLWFINYMNPYCIHCEHFRPTWEKLFAYFADQRDHGLYLANVDCSTNIHLCRKEEILGTPTLKLYMDGEYESNYEGQRTFEKLAKFINTHHSLYKALLERRVKSSGEEDAKIQPLKRIIQSAVKRDLVNPNGVVLELTDESWESALKIGPWLVECYAPWCTHCEKLAPVYTDLAKEMRGIVHVARVDGEAQKAVADRLGVEGYPTLMFFRNGEKIFTYDGQMTLGALAAFGKRVGKFEMPFISKEEFDTLSVEEPVFALMLFNAETTEAAVRVFSRTAEDMYYHLPFFVSTSHEILPSYSRPAIVVLRKNDPWSPHVYRKDITSRDDIRSFVSKIRYAFVQELSDFNLKDLLKTKILIVGLLNPLVHKNEMNVLNEISKDIRSRFREFGGLSAAKTLPGQKRPRINPEDREVKTVYFNSANWNSFAREFFGKEKTKVPSVAIVRHQEGLYYDTDEEGKPFEWGRTSILIQIENLVKEIKEGRPSPLLAKKLPGNEPILKSILSWRSVFALCIVMGAVYFVLRYLASRRMSSAQGAPSSHHGRASAAASYVKLAKSAGVANAAAQAYSTRKFE